MAWAIKSLQEVDWLTSKVMILVNLYLCFGPNKSGPVTLDQHINLILMMKLWVSGSYYDWPKCVNGLFDRL